MNWQVLQEVGELVFKASVVAWFWILSRRVRVAQLPPVSAAADAPRAGPYRTMAPRDQAIAVPRSVEDMTRAIEDATARLNEQLRTGKIDAYTYGEEVDWLSIAARKAGELKKRMSGDG